METARGMDFQVVVLAGGFSKSLVPLVSKEVPKALLPVANRPVLSYVLDLLEQNNIKDVIVVVEGETAALSASSWISKTYIDRLHVEVAAVPEDVGTAGALRAIDHRLTAKDVLVVSGRYNIIALDPTKQFLLHIAAGAEVEKDIRVQKSILRAVSQMEIRSDLMDAHMYAFKRF